ncbi:hypothetical protein R1sor_001083 [Riccia sorocarpa]|uniref:Uncharacterized protein n=1 Tax=Riccia sorocarpa TaxID=122646 RepID=A0ABD3GWM2_9MARC
MAANSSTKAEQRLRELSQLKKEDDAVHLEIDEIHKWVQSMHFDDIPDEQLDILRDLYVKANDLAIREEALINETLNEVDDLITSQDSVQVQTRYQARHQTRNNSDVVSTPQSQASCHLQDDEEWENLNVPLSACSVLPDGESKKLEVMNGVQYQLDEDSKELQPSADAILPVNDEEKEAGGNLSTNGVSYKEG